LSTELSRADFSTASLFIGLFDSNNRVGNMERREPFPERELHPYSIDQKPGFFLSWLFYKLLKKVKVDEAMREKLKQLQKQGTVVYTIKYRGRLDYLMYHYYFRANRFPIPKLAFDLNVSLLLPVTRFLKVYSSRFSSFFRTGAFPDPYNSGVYRNAILRGTTSLLFLVDEKGFMQHFIQFGKDRLEFLMELQRELARPIFLVPLLTLYRQGPEREEPTFQDVLFRFKDHPGAISKIILFFRHHRQALIDFGEPINLKEYCMESHPPDHSPSRIALELRNRLIGRIDNQKRVVLGPIMKSRQQFKETVLQDPALARKIESKSRGKKDSLKRLRRQAGAYFDEIAADYSIVYVHGLISVFRWFMKRVFEGAGQRMGKKGTGDLCSIPQEPYRLSRAQLCPSRALHAYSTNSGRKESGLLAHGAYLQKVRGLFHSPLLQRSFVCRGIQPLH
jgi:glycerol-3-phosphate O-acyltransferase